MRNFLKKIFYRNFPVTDYSSITTGDHISEKVFLKINDATIDVSVNHWAFCLQPVVFGIWLNKQPDISPLPDNNYSLSFEAATSQKKLAEIQLSFFSSIEEKDGTLLLVKVEKCKLFHIPSIESRLLYLLYYRKPGFSFEKFKSYVSAFSYPRKVRIISFQKEDYYNIFPMDFVGQPAKTKYYALGLRLTNKTLNEVIKTKKIVIAEVPFEYKEEIYKLGRHHSSKPLPLEQLPFKIFNSKNFGFPVPKWADAYNEISITRTLNLGSHTLLWGYSEHEEIRNTGRGNLYHVHFLLSLFQKRNGMAYTRV